MTDLQALTPNGWGGMGAERPPLPPISNKWPPLPPIPNNPETTQTNPEPKHG